MTLEREEHARFVAWLRDVAPLKWPRECIEGGGFPFIVSFSAGRRQGRALGWAKQQGLESGWPDFQIPIPRGDWSNLWIEMKRSEGRSTVSAAQKARLAWLNLHGHCARVAYGCDEAIEITTKYMNGWRKE